MNIQERYKLNKKAEVGEECVCPSCKTRFKKTSYQQAFCKSRTGTKCKDKYWNTVTLSKRNNITRISPANARWQNEQEERRCKDEEENEHPHSSEALGQW